MPIAMCAGDWCMQILRKYSVSDETPNPTNCCPWSGSRNSDYTTGCRLQDLKCMGVKTTAPFYTDPDTHLASCVFGTESPFRVLSGLGVALTVTPLSAEFTGRSRLQFYTSLCHPWIFTRLHLQAQMNDLAVLLCSLELTAKCRKLLLYRKLHLEQKVDCGIKSGKHSERFGNHEVLSYYLSGPSEENRKIPDRDSNWLPVENLPRRQQDDM